MTSTTKASARRTKPHIHKSTYALLLWCCSLNGVYGHGYSPAEAYRSWQAWSKVPPHVKKI